MYISFQKLKEHDVTQYELDLFTRQAHNFDEEKIRALILGWYFYELVLIIIIINSDGVLGDDEESVGQWAWAL